MSASQWYYAQNNQQRGPVAFEALQQMAAAGQLRPADLVWTESMSDWRAASKVPGLFAAPQVQAAPQPQAPPQAYAAPQAPQYPPSQFAAPQPYPQQAPPQAYPPYQQYPQYQQPGVIAYQTPTPPAQLPQGLAVASMVVGIGSMVLSCCMTFIGLPGGVVAIVLGAIAIRKANRGEAGGKGMAIAGLVLGIIVTVLSLVGIIWLGAIWSSAMKNSGGFKR